MKELTVAKRAAREAGKLVLSYLGNLKEVGYKSERDPVTEADKASEALIAGIIREAFPTHGFVSEEATAWEGDGLWVVDPLDGTVNFSHGYPMFCVSVALVRHGETVVGAVYEPLRREMFSAAKGKGAFLNGRPIHVSGQAYMKKALPLLTAQADLAGLNRMLGLTCMDLKLYAEAKENLSQALAVGLKCPECSIAIADAEKMLNPPRSVKKKPRKAKR